MSETETWLREAGPTVKTRYDDLLHRLRHAARPERPSPEAMAPYLDKVRLVSDDIAAGKFYRRLGKHCAWCDFLPVCLGDNKKAQDTLVNIA